MPFGSANRRQPAAVLAIAAAIVLSVSACGTLAASSSPRGHTDAASRANALADPPIATSTKADTEASLPRVSSSGRTVSALWQLPLVYPDISSGRVVGLAQTGSAARIEAVSALTGQPLWSVPTPTEPSVLGLSVEGSVVMVEAGR